MLLQSESWSEILQETSANGAYDKFINIVSKGFEQCFPLTKLSRKRSKDKKWITPALKESSRIKNKLYRRWIESRDPTDQCEYKKYKRVFESVAKEAEEMYYKEMFDENAILLKNFGKTLILFAH